MDPSLGAILYYELVGVQYFKRENSKKLSILVTETAFF